MSDRARLLRAHSGRALGLLAVAIVGATALLAATFPSGLAATSEWTAPATLSDCPATGAPAVVFPADSPDHGTGSGAVVWSDSARCPGGEGARVAAIGGAGRPLQEPGRAAARVRLPLRGALTASGAPFGALLVAGAPPPGADPGELLLEGRAEGAFAALADTGADAPPPVLATGYLGDVALLTRTPGSTAALRVRIQRHMSRGLESWVPVGSAGRGPIGASALAMDYRSDLVAVWWQGGAIHVRELPESGAWHPIEHLAVADADAQLTALMSDDNRAIVAWSEERAGECSVYLAISAPGVTFGAPELIERFAAPDGEDPPGPRLVRLSSESVMLAWSGAEDGRAVIRVAAVDLGGLAPIGTVSAPGGALLADLATGPHDEALVLWSEPQPQAGPVQLYATHALDAYPAPTVLGRPTELSAAAEPEASAAIDPDSGRAIAAWRSPDGSIEYAAGVAAQP